MATPRKRSGSSSSSDGDTVNTDQPALEQANDQGYLGDKVDPRDNTEYSLESGPDSPSAADVAGDAAQTSSASSQGDDA